MNAKGTKAFGAWRVAFFAQERFYHALGRLIAILLVGGAASAWALSFSGLFLSLLLAIFAILLALGQAWLVVQSRKMIVANLKTVWDILAEKDDD